MPRLIVKARQQLLGKIRWTEKGKIRGFQSLVAMLGSDHQTSQDP